MITITPSPRSVPRKSNIRAVFKIGTERLLIIRQANPFRRPKKCRQVVHVDLAEALLQDGPDIDDGVMSASAGACGTSGDAGRQPACRTDAKTAAFGSGGGVAKRNTPARIGVDHMAERERLAIGEPHHRCRMEAHADLETGGKGLRPSRSCKLRGIVARNAGRVSPVLDKYFECRCVTAALITLADDLRPFLVKIDQCLRDVLALLRIASQQVRALRP